MIKFLFNLTGAIFKIDTLSLTHSLTHSFTHSHTLYLYHSLSNNLTADKSGNEECRGSIGNSVLAFNREIPYFFHHLFCHRANHLLWN